MKKLGKNNCGEEITLHDVKQKLLQMLIVFAEFCEKNGIRYYLSGGTLLGAVRHEGFIPWDDDIDLNIPRPDCEKLQEISGGKIGKYVLVPPNPDLLYPSNFWRLYDNSVVIENTLKNSVRKPVYHPLFIDIFPIEGLPEEEKLTKSHYDSMVLSKKMFGMLNTPVWTGKTLSKKLIHTLVRPFALVMGKNYWFSRIQKIAQSIPFGSTNYIGVMMTNIHTVEERVRIDEFLPSVKVNFEGHQFNGPKGYDIYLRQLYGEDYMQLPPEEKRQSHHGFHFYNYTA